MTTSRLTLNWASKPECKLPVAEIWIDENELLWLVLFVDDSDGKLYFEILPSYNEAAFQVDFTEAERLIDAAKRDLIAMSSPPG